MTGCTKIVIPRDGHLQTVESVTLPACIAFETVQTQGYDCWFAERSEDSEMITLHRRLFKCAGCGNSFSLEQCTEYVESSDYYDCGPDEDEWEDYKFWEDELKDNERDSDDPTAINRQSFAEWALQLTLPGFEPKNSLYRFHPKLDSLYAVACPHCGTSRKIVISRPAFEVSADRHSTSVAQQFSRDEPETKLLCDVDEGNCLFPLTLRLIFNHDTHRTLMKITDRNDIPVKFGDITGQHDALSGYQMADTVKTSPELRNTLMDSFTHYYAGKFPFKDDEVTLDLLVLLNRFQGYPRVFYDAIPFDNTGGKIHKGFAGISAELEKCGTVPTLYENLGLPGTKAIRRAIFENPGLLFYADQLNALPVQNRDMLLRILKSEKSYHLLSLMQELPGVLDFLNCLVAAKGESGAWRIIQNNFVGLRYMAGMFFLLPPQKQAEYLKGGFNAHPLAPFYEAFTPPYNLPVNRSYKIRIPPCTINGYIFDSLKSSIEYNKAAKELRNCLAYCMDRWIIGVKRDGKYVAAIEIECDYIVQVELVGNISICRNKRIFEAYLEFVRQNNLKGLPDN
jgi:hypothetical protein